MAQLSSCIQSLYTSRASRLLYRLPSISCRIPSIPRVYLGIVIYLVCCTFNMETSSPLAAMHPPAGPFGQPDRFRSHPHTLFHSLNQPRGSGTLDFAEQFQRSRPDYFNVKSVRGSSPAASLAADLCQNFHIDNDARLAAPASMYCKCGQIWLMFHSPHFPTPRRALFTTSTIMNGMEARGKAHNERIGQEIEN